MTQCWQRVGAYFLVVEVSQMWEVMTEKVAGSVDNEGSSLQNAVCPIAIPDHQRSAYSHWGRKALYRGILKST